MQAGRLWGPTMLMAHRHHQRQMLLFGFSLVAVVACSDSSNSKSPTDPSQRLSLRPGASVPVFMNSQAVLTLNGRSLAAEYRNSRTITVVKDRGKAKIEMTASQPRRSTPLAQDASLSRAFTLPKDFTKFAAVQSDGVNFTPVVAVTTGDYTGNFDVLDTDSSGNKVRTVATSSGGAPFSDVKVYQNAGLVGWIHSEWTPVSGGYILNFQKQVNYASGAPAFIVMTSVTAGYSADYQPVAAMKSDVTDFFASAFRRVGKRVACALMPTTALAQGRITDRYCWREGLVLAGVTAAEALTIYTWSRQPKNWFPGKVEITAFHMEVAAWAWALTDYLRCLNEAHKEGKKP